MNRRHQKWYILAVLLRLVMPVGAQSVVPADTLIVNGNQWQFKSDSTQVGADSILTISEETEKGVASAGTMIGDSARILSVDTLQASADSVAQPQKKQAIDAPVEYSSKDSLVMMGNGVAHIYGNGDVKYQKMELIADYIRVQMDSSTMFASGVLDTIENEWVGKPVFKDGKDSYESNELTYNLKTQKGFIRHVVTEQGEGYVVAERTKKTEGDVMMMAGGHYTTCDEHDHPHFYLKMTKAKVKPGDYIATGPAYLVVGEVPLPLAIPFGFFPFNKTYSSGLIMPNFGDDYQKGLYLSGLGYYFAINDYMDLELKGDIYTRGTWAVSVATRYVKRYKFRGNFNVNYRWDVDGEKGMPNYGVNKNLQVQWTHTQDSKANPYNNFSASVNFKTSGYNRSNINSYYNVAANSENTTSSSISYTQRFPESPWNINMSMTLNQRTKDSTISFSAPNLTVSMSRIYPFKRKNPLGKEKWYEKISLQYSGAFTNSITCKEDYLLHSDYLRDWDYNLRHQLSSSASFMAFKYLSITPSVNFTDRMFFSRVDQTWNEQQNQLQRDTTMGFYNVYNFSASVSFSTKLYGFYIPYRKWFGDKVDRFRHVLTPTMSISYHPDFGKSFWASRYGGFYGSYDQLITTTDADGNIVSKLDDAGQVIYETKQYCRFREGPGQGAAATLSFSLGNNLEMKLRNDRDTTGKEPYKVVSLIDNFNISGGYNFIADSMNWSTFNVGLRIKIPKVNYTINLNGQFDPYMYTTTASGAHVRCNELYWNHGRFPHFLGTSMAFSYTFNNQVVKGWFNRKEKGKSDSQSEQTDNPDGENQEDFDPALGQKKQDEKQEATDDGYVFAEIPWSLGVNYNIRYGEGREWDEKRNYYKMELRQTLQFSISLGLGKGWKANTSLNYDINARKMAYSSISVSRDLHCWSMSATFVPFGPYKSYNFHIGVNASMLADLKYDKSSSESTSKAVNWW